MTDAFACLPGIALDAVRHALLTGDRRLPDVADLRTEVAEPGAAFVTLERDHELLGCIGSLTRERPLGVDVAHSALAAAFDDPRLPPVVRDDYPVMCVTVSVLSEPTPLDVCSRADLEARLEPGVDGVVIEHLRSHATFLPAVWEKLPHVSVFVDALWSKAGLDPQVWDAHVRVCTYTTVELVDRGPRAPLDEDGRVG
jgi:AmmeMemoRadiSam system protein A